MTSSNDNGNGNGNYIPDEQFVRRFERSLDVQRDEFQKTRDDVNALKQTQNVIQRDIATLANSIQSLGSKMDERAKTNWPALAIAVTMFLSFIPMGGFVMTTYTANAISPVANRTELNSQSIGQLNTNMHVVESMASASRQSDANSLTDRQQLNDRIAGLEKNLSSEVADRRSTSAAVKVSLVEIETQFCSSDTVRNVIRANDLRTFAVLWRKTMGEELPIGNAFYPTVCHRDSVAVGQSG